MSSGPPSKRLKQAVLSFANKVGIFCETRWIEKHTTLSNFMELYEPIVACLDAIGSIEADWDSKTSTAAYGLLKSITDHAFIVSFHIVRHFFCYVKGLSAKLQGSTLDVIQGYEMVTSDRAALNNARQDDSEWEHVFEKATKMADSWRWTNYCPKNMLKTDSPKQHTSCNASRPQERRV